MLIIMLFEMNDVTRSRNIILLLCLAFILYGLFVVLLWRMIIFFFLMLLLLLYTIIIIIIYISMLLLLKKNNYTILAPHHRVCSALLPLSAYGAIDRLSPGEQKHSPRWPFALLCASRTSSCGVSLRVQPIANQDEAIMAGNNDILRPEKYAQGNRA